MIEHKFPYESFIGGWYIDEKICDEVISFFKNNLNKTHSGYTTDKKGNVAVLKEIKDSTDMTIDPKINIGSYRQALQEVLENYIKKYPDVNNLQRFDIREEYIIQHYKKGGGYKHEHCERGGLKSSWRNLVFMTYLNDVDDGGTHFKHQKITTPAKKGLTLIWPSDWTHMHKGQISNTKEKYIVTGWYNYEQ